MQFWPTTRNPLGQAAMFIDCKKALQHHPYNASMMMITMFLYKHQFFYDLVKSMTICTEFDGHKRKVINQFWFECTIQSYYTFYNHCYTFSLPWQDHKRDLPHAMTIESGNFS